MFKKNLFLILSLLLIAFVYLLFNYAFRTPILVGFILAALTYPLFKFFNNSIERYNIKYISKSITALTTIIISGIIIYYTSSYIVIEFLKELNSLTPSVIEEIAKVFDSQEFKDIASYIGLNSNETKSLSENIINSIIPYLSSIINFDNFNRILNVSTQLLNLVFNQLLYIVISVIAWYNGLVFGKGWIETLIKLLPIERHQKEAIKHDLNAGIRNVIYANLVSGILNGLAVLFLMSFFGAPGAFLGAFFAFLIGFLPLSPSELSFLPLIVYLFLTNPPLVILVLIIGELFVLFLNYVLLPKITLGSSEGNPLFIITSVLSGIAIFGVMGFIIGPTIMIFINTLSNITIGNIGEKNNIDSI